MPEAATTLAGGKYQTVKRLAVGGMGEVYLAREYGRLGFSRLVVIKRLLPQYARDRYFVEMFVDEARIIGNLHHPNICQILELGEEDGIPFLALEYVRGESLSGIWDRAHERNANIPRVITLRVLADTAWALHFAHEARDADSNALNIIHRDISPHNVMVSFHGDVKLMDFGIARADNRQHRTDTGKIKGKISYMAPEQLRGQPLDRRTDVFAVGVMLWELTLGRRLFGGGGEVETLQKATVCDVPRPTSIDRSYPVDLEEIVMNALARNREQRTATAGELATALVEQVNLHGGCERGDVASALRELFPVESVLAEDIPSAPPPGKQDTNVEMWRQAKHELHARPTAPLAAADPNAAPPAFDVARADFRPTAPLRSESSPEITNARPTAPLRAEARGVAQSPSELRPTAPMRAEPATTVRAASATEAPRKPSRARWIVGAMVAAVGAMIAIVVATRPDETDSVAEVAPPIVASAEAADATVVPPKPEVVEAPPPVKNESPPVDAGTPPSPSSRDRKSSRRGTAAAEPPKEAVITKSPVKEEAQTPPPPAEVPTPAAAPTAGTLAVSSTRNGLVVIDDKPQKTTPFQKQLAAGEYNVAVELAEGAGTVRARARIEGGKKTKCKVEGNALSCASPQ